MTNWPHAPIHILDEAGTFMVTAGTHGKMPFFNTPEKLSFHHDLLLSIADEKGWLLQAWAVMSNHYHFVAISPDNPENLRALISKLHMLSAKEINRLDNTPGRPVWFQYWDTRITRLESYYPRLKYVHNNPAHHGIAADASTYQWCSSAWFNRTADDAFRKTLESFKTDRINVIDDF